MKRWLGGPTPLKPFDTLWGRRPCAQERRPQQTGEFGTGTCMLASRVTHLGWLFFVSTRPGQGMPRQQANSAQECLWVFPEETP